MVLLLDILLFFFVFLVYLLLGYFCFNSPGVTGYSGIHSWKVKLNNDNSSSSSKKFQTVANVTMIE
jgi:hypothetical protein